MDISNITARVSKFLSSIEGKLQKVFRSENSVTDVYQSQNVQTEDLSKLSKASKIVRLLKKPATVLDKLIGSKSEEAKGSMRVQESEVVPDFNPLPSTSQGYNRPQPPTPLKTEISLPWNASLTSTCTPQAALSGFGDETQFYNSEFGSKDHISNLWRHDIEVGGQKVSFVRSGSTRGNDQATKELLANAVALQYDINELPANATVYLNLSNIQLMTPVGKVADGGIPLKQMEALFKLYEQGEKTKVKYGNKTITVQLTKPPLLFNFGVNFQHFEMGKLAHSKEVDDFNKRSFNQLFGVDPQKLELKRTQIYGKDSLIGKFLSDPKVKDPKKAQVKALAEQIAFIRQNYPNGIRSNPYALPVRVMLLTNLLGYATTYGCKSGKDRTGVCAMELECLAAKLLSSKELYDPEKPSQEEKNLLQQIYLKGEAIEIAKADKAQQNNLKMHEMLGFKSLQERFGVKLKEDFKKNSLELYVNECNKLYKELSENIKKLSSRLKELKQEDERIKGSLEPENKQEEAVEKLAGASGEVQKKKPKIGENLTRLGELRISVALLIENAKEGTIDRKRLNEIKEAFNAIKEALQSQVPEQEKTTANPTEDKGPVSQPEKTERKEESGNSIPATNRDTLSAQGTVQPDVTTNSEAGSLEETIKALQQQLLMQQEDYEADLEQPQKPLP